jgi:hypothetical protein
MEIFISVNLLTKTETVTREILLRRELIFIKERILLLIYKNQLLNIFKACDLVPSDASENI